MYTVYSSILIEQFIIAISRMQLTLKMILFYTISQRKPKYTQPTQVNNLCRKNVFFVTFYILKSKIIKKLNFNISHIER